MTSSLGKSRDFEKTVIFSKVIDHVLKRGGDRVTAPRGFDEIDRGTPSPHNSPHLLHDERRQELNKVVKNDILKR